MAVRYFIGTSGWHYDDWRHRFYPKGLAKSGWLEFYSRHFTTLELNNTFYRLPAEAAFENWHNTTPDDFVFSVKISRFITHIKRLKDSFEAVTNFMSKTALLKDKLGPILYQLPPGLHRDDDLLEKFLASLPTENKYVFEFRHESWLNEAVYDILRRYNAGICVFDMPGLSSPLVATADFTYIRFHGKERLYSSRYGDEEMADWAEKINGIAGNLDEAYIYFNNDIQGFALENARTLRDLLQS